MTEEELEKEADEYAKKDCPDNFLCTRAIAKRGYLAGAEPREKRIAELEQQVSKLEKYARWWIEENICMKK